ETPAWAHDALRRCFRAAHLEATTRDWQLSLPADRTPRLVAHAPRTRTAPSRNHDRARKRALSTSATDWLHGLGIVDSSGKMLARLSDKHHTDQRYAEILRQLFD